jgi:MOB kinase activator 1
MSIIAVDFFNHLNILYGTITEFCIPQEVRCPNDRPNEIVKFTACACLVSNHVCGATVSTALRTRLLHLRTSDHSRYEYMWEDGVRYKRPTKLPAPEYVDALMNWAQGLLDDEAIFPNKIGSPYASLFLSRIFELNTYHQVFPSRRPFGTPCAPYFVAYSVYMRIYTAVTLTTYARWE